MQASHSPGGPKLSTLVGHCGEEDGRWIAEQSAQAVRYLETFCGQNGIDCQYRQGGWLWAASSAAQVGAWDSVLEAARSRDLELFEPVGIEEARRRGGSPRLLGGILDRSAARVHPGLLARGLRRVACDRGIRVYEESPVTGVDGSRPLTVRAVAGTVTADVVVSALNAWTFSLPQFRRLRRAVIPIASDMVASAPNPDLLERIGLTGGEVVSDSRMMVHYYRTTDDGRITFGKGGGAIAVAGYFGEGFHYDRRRAELTAHELRSLNPALAGLEVTHAWSGPVDRSINGLPFFGRADGQESMVYGVGFSGNGVAQCITGAKILAGWRCVRTTGGRRVPSPGVRRACFLPSRCGSSAAASSAVRSDGKSATRTQGRRLRRPSLGWRGSRPRATTRRSPG